MEERFRDFAAAWYDSPSSPLWLISQGRVLNSPMQYAELLRELEKISIKDMREKDRETLNELHNLTEKALLRL